MGPNRNQKNGSRTPSLNGTDPLKAGIRFSSLSARDLKDIMPIEEACYSRPWSSISFDQILKDHRTFSTLAARTFGNTLVGYVVYSIVADELHILNVAINPTFRRQHLATLMLMQIHQKALAANCQKAFLEVRESNSAAQNLYQKFGYKSVSRRKDYYTDTHEDALVMIAPLKSKPNA